MRFKRMQNCLHYIHLSFWWIRIRTCCFFHNTIFGFVTNILILWVLDDSSFIKPYTKHCALPIFATMWDQCAPLWDKYCVFVLYLGLQYINEYTWHVLLKTVELDFYHMMAKACSVFLSTRYIQKIISVYCFRFDEKENVSNCIQLKTSVIKGIKNQLLEQFPDIESWLNHIMPKKDPVKIVRW